MSDIRPRFGYETGGKAIKKIGIGSSETKDVSIVENGFEFLNPFELSSIRPAVVQSKEALLSLLMAQDLLKLEIPSIVTLAALQSLAKYIRAHL